MKQVSIGIIGTGWCGGIRAEACAASPYVSALHLAEIRDRPTEGSRRQDKAGHGHQRITGPCSNNQSIDAIIISATPETTHYPMAKESLLAGKHVFLEKPIALELSEADELIALARSKKLALHHRIFAALQSQVRLRQSARSTTARSVSRSARW